MIEKSDKKRPEMVQAVLKRIEDLKIKHVWMQFTDINGIMKSFGVASFRLPEVLESGGTFDGSSVTGYGVVEESDMVALPDPTTFAVIPWRSNENSVGRFLCDIYTPDGNRYSGDPRWVLQKIVKKAESMGYSLRVAPELEFFVLRENGQDAPTTSDLRGYFDADPSDESHLIRRDISLYAENFPDIKVETTHHEAARSQHEVDIRYADAVPMADACITMKMITKAVAQKHNMIATFMPKPWNQHNGSGMHVHQSIWDKQGETNLFYDEKDPQKISQLMRYFIGGQLKYAKEFTAVLNSWPNSYKRLVPGYEAPTYISWGFKNRSMLIRVPNFFNKAKAARCEIRSPDPAGNPYLQFAVLLGTGLEGIEKKIDPPTPTEINVFHIPEEEKIKMGIQNLPESLGQALHNLRNSEIMKQILGAQTYKSFMDSKM
jgi:glutamine synthetase